MAADTAGPAQQTKPAIRIFQSYGWHDATKIAEQLRASLAEAGFDVWIDREHLRADDKHFSLALEEAINNCEVVVALLSPHSVRGPAEQDERSSICYNELRLAEWLQRPIVPIRVQRLTGPPSFLIIKYRRIDWLEWERPDAYQKGVQEIIDTIGRVLAKDKNLDPDIFLQAESFVTQLRTARDQFTGRDWLFRRIEDWLDSDRRSFLIEGATGSGKTAIVAELVRRNPGGRILAYHFCTATQNDPATFVRSIAGMLAQSIDAYGDLLWNGRLSEWLKATDPHTMLAQGVLAQLHGIAMDGHFCIVVDGLDEAFGTTTSPSLPQLLANAVEDFPDWLKLLVTSRPHARIQRLFRAAETAVLGGGTEDQQMDLRAYIGRRLAAPVMRTPLGEADAETTAALIEERAAGSFQYAGSVLDALATGEIRVGQLDQLPRSLEDFYYKRAELRFPNPGDFRVARIVLALLLAAREALTLDQLARFSGLDQDGELSPTLDRLSCFVSQERRPGTDDIHRLAHKSIADWLLSTDAGRFRVDPARGRDQLLAHCRGWRTHRDPYALRHAVAHLLEAGLAAEALQMIGQGLFADRLGRLGEPRLDGEDSRNLTLALVAARDKEGIVTLAQTENIWQRDGVAAALQSTVPEDLEFVDQVVATLLDLKP